MTFVWDKFVQLDTHQVLADPIQSKLRANHCYYVIARPCLVEAARKGQIKGEAKAIRVPRSKNDQIPPQAFSFHTFFFSTSTDAVWA